jgi:hypothetical protein
MPELIHINRAAAGQNRPPRTNRRSPASHRIFVLLTLQGGLRGRVSLQIDDWNACPFVVVCVAGDDHQAMLLGGRGDKEIGLEESMA